MRPVRFATGNRHKAREVSEILGEFGISVEHIDLSLTEIQSDNLEEIARTSVKEAAEIAGKPIMVEDAGLFIDALKGFPGPYSAYVYRTLGNTGIIKLMKGAKNRRATFKSALAFYGSTLAVFTGETRGQIAPKERGEQWGFDPVFIPHSNALTYAQMGSSEKNKLSHRRRALEKFVAAYRRGGL